MISIDKKCLILLITISLSLLAQPALPPGPLDWPAIKHTYKPWTRWWWLGSAVDKTNLTYNLERYQRAGLGGVEITPIYGVKGAEDKFIDYLSPQWLDLLTHVMTETRRLEMGVDMTTGTGWPFGGPNIDLDRAAARVEFKTFELQAGKLLDTTIPPDRLLTLMAYKKSSQPINLISKVNARGELAWLAPKGTWTLYAVYLKPGVKKVERAAPGGAGYVVDHFDQSALQHYLKRFDNAFLQYKSDPVRCYFNDSYEVDLADWTAGLFDEFLNRRGYDLRHHLPELTGKGDPEIVARIKADYRRTVNELLLDEFTRYWSHWAHLKGSQTRSQAHGSPGNWLDLYAAVDIPETEIFRQDRDLLVSKFASSAAHISGRPLTSAEACTWIGEHFQVSLADAKPVIDELFLAGVNHIFYHGTPYSPLDDPWPGRLFYASVHFAPSNPIWRDFPALNTYVTHCQSVLQNGQSDNGILLYWPQSDAEQTHEGLLHTYSIHNVKRWLYPTPCYKSAKYLWERGYAFDYISDRMIMDLTVERNQLRTGDKLYKTLVIPKTKYIPIVTFAQLEKLVEAGARVIIQDSWPTDVPGFHRFEDRRRILKAKISRLQRVSKKFSGITRISLGRGRFSIGKDLDKLLNLHNVTREPVVDFGLDFIRRQHKDGYHYFLLNQGKTSINRWISISKGAASAVILDSLTGRTGIGRIRQHNGQTQVYLQLTPGQSCILRTFRRIEPFGEEWPYFKAGKRDIALGGEWKIEFIDGGPELPEAYTTRILTSWTKRNNELYQRFSGMARYSITFKMVDPGIADEWRLDLGEVYHSARVRVNGKEAGLVWCDPYALLAGSYIRKGENRLEVEVTNLAANRIRDLDIRKVNWKKFYEINYVNIDYNRFDASGWPVMDSGLMGPVKLVPLERFYP